MSKVEKNLNTLTILLLASYYIHLGNTPFLNYLGLADLVFYCLPIFVAFSTCDLFGKSLESKRIKVLFELGFIFLAFVSLVFLVNKTSHAMYKIAHSGTNTYLQTSIDSRSNDLNTALHSNDHERSRRIANFIYSEFGLKVPFKTEKSVYVPFEPTEQEVKKRAKRLETADKEKQTNLLAADNATNYEWMANYLLISFSVSFFFFTCIAVYRRNRL